MPPLLFRHVGIHRSLTIASRRWLSLLPQLPKSPRLRYARWAGYVALGLGGVYGVDRTLNASAISRNFRTLWICAMISADYKLNFTPEHADRIPQIHQRVADRMYDLFTLNGGLYIKIGESYRSSLVFLAWY